MSNDDARRVEDEKKSLNRQRGAIKARLTILSNYVANSVGKSLSEADIINLQERISKADTIYAEFDQIQNKIENLVSDAEIDAQHKERAAFEDSFFTAISSAKQIVLQYKRESEQQVNSGASNSASVNGDTDVSNAQIMKNVKFPVISMPKFDGKMDNWLEFRDTFKSLIHDNELINNIQKYHYLRASLEGGAAQVIRSIDLSSANYPVAWETLNDRYNNKQLLIHIHTKALFNVETIQRECASKIRNLIDSVSKHLRSLQQLGEPTEQWDTLINYLVSSKLDSATTREWEKHKIGNDFTTWSDLKEFLRGRSDMLETIEEKIADKLSIKNNSKRLVTSSTKNFLGNASGGKCSFCKREHLIYSCSEFLNLAVKDRIDFISKSKLCTNCLKGGHFERTCKFGPCKQCHRRHNTLLHINKTSNEGCNTTTNDTVNQVSLSSINNQIDEVLLSTACIRIIDKHNNAHTVRALLDCGSQSSFITNDLINALGLEKSKTNITVAGLNQTWSGVQYKCTVNIQSSNGGFTTDLICLVIPKITNNLPSIKIHKTEFSIPKNIGRLADPNFNIPSKIDVLLGADIFWKVLCVGQIELGPNKPIMQKTRLGWVISGTIGKTHSTKCNLSTKNTDLHDQLAKFWEIEESLPNRSTWSMEENDCEKHFLNNTLRDRDGRFIVSLPLKRPATDLGDSKEQAIKRFLSLERRFSRDENLRNQYVQFMAEYKEMGHMQEIDLSNENSQSNYYMPHHGVLKSDSITTRLRVVFDASAPSTSGISLNDLQMIGPTIQNDLLSIIMRFRFHYYVVSADIQKMYRMVLVNQNDRSLQRIVWRDTPTEPIKHYNLQTVTYGQAASSFLAIRCIFELANQFDTDIRISNIIKNDFYVDDLLTGSNSIEDAIYICKTISSVLNSGCFLLRKWTSNEPEIVKNIGSSELPHNILNLGKDQNAKTLGLIWNCSTDSLMYKIDVSSRYKNITKRRILSHISQIFDPLGLLAPCTIIAKITIQKLWIEKYSWDESLPINVHSSWVAFERELPVLNSLKIPRLVLGNNCSKIELHGFSDASQSAYGGCFFIRSISTEGEISINLLCAKTRVAPIKTQTLPRLELCGAVVLTRLLERVLTSIFATVTISRCVLWTDSTIVLGWIGTSPHLLKTFVSNRISEIQSITEKYEWRYVPTKDNPADMLSRGLHPGRLKDAVLWWQGPSWLKHYEANWPTALTNENNLPEIRDRNVSCLFTSGKNDFPFEIFSNFNKLVRVTAFIFRFVNNCKIKHKPKRVIKMPLPQTVLTNIERNNALLHLIKLQQQECFPLEYNSLVRGQAINSKSSILSLNPFMDDNNVIRVGGRLNNSGFKYDKKHPIILSPGHRLTILLFESEHKRLLHVGPLGLLNSIRERFWPIGGRNLARKITRTCLRCFKANPRPIHTIMGNLPKDRLVADFPFHIVGVDYGGPFLIKDRKGRGAKHTKGYVCIFICFATKAINIELVSSLTSEAFILALRRFVGRRGKPERIYSDNGTNFVRANKDLSELGKFLISQNKNLEDSFSHEGIEWKFIPVNSPHFGGLWEAGVKSIKYHLRRVMGNASLMFEELCSLLVQVEAVVNSRPLHPLSTDPNDMNSLTPAHFLVGKLLTDVPDPDVRHIPDNRLSNYQRIQRLRQHFWCRWKKDYVSELQQRSKWCQVQPKVEENALVLVKEDNSPPMKWCLGRVTRLHPGKDNVTRVVSIKTVNGEIKRAITKICPLPISTK